jgi:hypothetical protein
MKKTKEVLQMKNAKIVTWIGLALMTFGLINGFLKGDFIKDGGKLLSNPWGIMSMIGSPCRYKPFSKNPIGSFCQSSI